MTIKTLHLEEYARLGTLSEPHRLIVFPAAPSAKPSPLFQEDSLPLEVKQKHYETVFVEDTYVYAFTNVELGGTGLFLKDGHIHAPAHCFPDYLEQSAKNKPSDYIWLGAMLKPDAPVMKLDGPVFMPFHANFVYGHFLLEMLPKLLMIKKLHQL